jgi:hypothetical protein
MTDNLPATDKRIEQRLPVIVCPFCGEKDPHKLALSSVEREYDLEIENLCYEPRDAIEHIPTHKNNKVTIDGECISCLTSFQIIISARTPYK